MSKHIQNAYDYLVNEVKNYKKQLTVGNPTMTEKTRFYPFVVQKKFDHGDKMIENLLFDSLARVANSFYKEDYSDNKELTKVLAIYFEKSDDAGVFTNDFKVKIKKVIFTQKGKSLSHKKYIIDILNYCHGRSDKFITE
jgi:hypothetical protein